MKKIKVYIAIVLMFIMSSSMVVQGSELDKRSVHYYINNAIRTDRDYYEDQLKSDHLPYRSCISAVAKMVINISGKENNRYKEESIGSISKMLGTNNNGAYLDDMNNLLVRGGIKNNNTLYLNYSPKEKIIKDAIIEGNVVACLINTGKLIGKVSEYSEAYNHGVLVVGIAEDSEFNTYFIVADPLGYKDELAIRAEEFSDALIWDRVYSYGTNTNSKEKIKQLRKKINN